MWAEWRHNLTKGQKIALGAGVAVAVVVIVIVVRRPRVTGPPWSSSSPTPKQARSRRPAVHNSTG